jgi:hypothetical protein
MEEAKADSSILAVHPGLSAGGLNTVSDSACKNGIKCQMIKYIKQC